MSRARCALLKRTNGFPRVSGDEPEVRVLTCDGLPFSPRERG